MEKLKPILNETLKLVDSLPFPRKLVIVGAAVVALVGVLLITGTGGTSAGDVARICEDEATATMNFYSSIGDRRSAAIYERARDICCEEMREAAREISSYERDVVIAEMARSMDTVYSANDLNSFISLYESARDNSTPAEWQRINYPSSVRNQCFLRLYQ